MSMKHRHVFRTRNVGDAGRALQAAVAGGIPDGDIYVVARRDIEMDGIADRYKMADSDLIPAALRGVLIGSGLGLVVAIVLMFVWGAPLWSLWIAIPVGAAVGGLAASLAGASIQDPVRRQFASDIEAGHVLIVVDAAPESMPAVHQAMEIAGATPLSYDAPSAMT
jgi:hypothetical protein